MIEAVVFDVGRVLFQWQLSALMEKIVHDPVELDFVLREVVSESWHFQHDGGRPLAEMIPERKAAFPGYERAIEAYATRFNESIPGPVPGSLEIVRELDEAGVPLYAITNFGSDFWDGFRPTQPIFDRFRDIVVSGKERMTKPGPEIYELAAKRFGRAPSAMLFIDDNPANVAAAREGGWHAHRFLDAVTLRRDLVERGFLKK